jgi:hypothetical protein
MNRWVKIGLITFGLFFYFLSGIFFIAGISPDLRVDILVQGGMLLFIGSIPVGIVVYLEKKESSRPMTVTQNINIDGKDLVGGERKISEIRCRGCSAGLSSDDVRITDIGVLVKCPYCGKGYVIEEEPKW